MHRGVSGRGMTEGSVPEGAVGQGGKDLGLQGKQETVTQGGGGGEGGPSWLAAQSADSGQEAAGLDTTGWFDSNLPPAAAQPEAVNIRASDEDPESRLAHEGLAEDLPDPVFPDALPPAPLPPA